MSRRRIVIYGVTGSGKSTLGRRLAHELGLKHIELDSLYHGPNWTPAPPEEFLVKVAAAAEAAPEGRVADGNYSVVRPLLLCRADTAVWLHLPWRVSYLRMLRRTFSRAVTRKELWNGNKESLRLMFFDKDSLLLWGIHHHRQSVRSARAALFDSEHSAAVFELRTTREVEELVRRLSAQREEGISGSGIALDARPH